MRGLDDGEPLAGKLPHARQNAHGVAVVEGACGLVHHDGLRVLRQGSGNERHLLLAARDLGIGAMRQMGDADLVERLHRAVLVGLARVVEQTQVGSGAHEHDVDDLVVVDARMRLRDVGDELGALADGHLPQVAPVDQDLAGVVGVEAQDAAEKRRLAHAVGTQHVDKRAVGNGEADVVQDLARTVGKAQMLDLDRH